MVPLLVHKQIFTRGKQFINKQFAHMSLMKAGGFRFQRNFVFVIQNVTQYVVYQWKFDVEN